MLVLSRRIGEEVTIGTAVVKVLQVEGGRVRLGIDAPEDIHILRRELEPKDDDREAAA